MPARAARPPRFAAPPRPRRSQGVIRTVEVDEPALRGAELDGEHVADEHRVVPGVVLVADAALEPATRLGEQRCDAGGTAARLDPLPVHERREAGCESL